MRSHPNTKGTTHNIMVLFLPSLSIAHPARGLPKIAPTVIRDCKKIIIIKIKIVSK